MSVNSSFELKYRSNMFSYNLAVKFEYSFAKLLIFYFAVCFSGTVLFLVFKAGLNKIQNFSQVECHLCFQGGVSLCDT